MTDFWLAHIAFGLLAFLLLARFGTGMRLQSAKLLLCLLLSLVPLQGMSLALQLRTYMGDLSISSLVLLSWVAFSRFGLPALATQGRLLGLGLFAALAVLLYPAALGLSYSDPYQLGFEPRSMLLVIGLLCVILIVLRSWFSALALVLATLAFALRLNASENYWDYLIDPYLALYSFGALVAAGLRRLQARRRRPLLADARSRA